MPPRKTPPSTLTVICDFDGTITTRDIGEALCGRFAPGVLARVDALWHAGELTFWQAHAAAFREVRAAHEEIVAAALEDAVVREGFGDLARACRETGAELVVASAGLDLYVDPILHRELGALAAGLERRVNRGSVTGDGVAVHFEHADPSCPECGSCKALRARQARQQGRTVVAVGDSFSDRCLVRAADRVFARAWLADHCRASGVPHETFEDFHGVTRLVREAAARSAPPG